MKVCTALQAPATITQPRPVIAPRSLMSPVATRYSGGSSCTSSFRSYMRPFCHRNTRCAPLAAIEVPAIWPKSLTPVASASASPGSACRLMMPPGVHSAAWKFGVSTPPTTSPGVSEKPTMMPLLLMAMGVFQPLPPSVASRTGRPFSHSTAWRALKAPTATSQSPEIPTASPASLMAVAAELESFASGASTRCCPGAGPHATASNCSCCGATQVASCRAVSAQPTATPALLTPVAKPLLPPRRGSAPSVPFCHRNGRQVCPLVAMKAPQEKVSPSGSAVAVSEMPTTRPWLFLTGHSTALLVPPRVPRSMTVPGLHSAACSPPPASAEPPEIQPSSLMPLPKPLPPPSVPVS